jgi:hypothetical protein
MGERNGYTARAQVCLTKTVTVSSIIIICAQSSGHSIRSLFRQFGFVTFIDCERNDFFTPTAKLKKQVALGTYHDNGFAGVYSQLPNVLSKRYDFILAGLGSSSRLWMSVQLQMLYSSAVTYSMRGVQLSTVR